MKGAAEVVDNKYDVIGRLLSEIGGALGHIVDGNPEGTFLYAEGGEGWMASGVFKEEDGFVRYYRPSRELGDLILQLWNAEDPDKRWAVMEYVVEGTKFDTQFQFADQIDPNESEYERRPRALKRWFGDKPVIYPPVPTVDD
jgi:hypothetical protein